MRQLLLLRHAKAVEGLPGQADITRALNPRGRADAPRIGAWIMAKGLTPGLTLVSPARRTAETWALLGLDGAPMRAEPQLYPGHAERMLALARAQAPDLNRLLLVGHQPGLSDLCYLLLGPDAPEAFPTAALALLSFPGDWAELGRAPARLVALVTPADLRPASSAPDPTG